jgi:hypothetical protein
MTDVAGDHLERMRRAAAAATLRQAEIARTRTIERTPTDRGNLKGSYFVAQDGTSAQLGTDAPYAIYVHEDLSDQHDDGQAKFMEAAVLDGDARQVLAAAAAEAARRVLGG